MSQTTSRAASADAEACDICLVDPPFTAVTLPALGVSIMAAACRQRGMSVKLLFGSLQFAADIGFDDYMAVCRSSIRVLLGERLFVPHLYPPDTVRGPGIILPDEMKALRQKIADKIGPSLERLAARVLVLKPRIVGISTNFQQNLASLSLARLIKQRAPETIVVLGGANVAMPMGGALAKVFPFVDHVFSGEADTAFPDFCERVLRVGNADEPKVFECKPINDMKVVSAPDFSDYFEQLRVYQGQGALPGTLPEFLTMECSRGCWWGAKNHCTFCGLNGEGMDFRQKSGARVLEEIDDVQKRWGAKRIHVADNILPISFFRDVMPILAARDQSPRMFYEVKANLRDDQLDLMALAKIDAIQPGIESLSTHVLKLMRKGVSGLQNVALLRSCQSRNIRGEWNYLYGFPGETCDDYRRAMELVPKIEHLQPPTVCVRIVIDRFSPYHSDPDGFGIGRISPTRAYPALYPADAPLSDIAYHFDGDYTTAFLDDADLLAEFRATVENWKTVWKTKRPRLGLIELDADKIAVVDTRSVAVQGMTVISRDAEQALRHFERARPVTGIPESVAPHVEDLLKRHFLVQHEDKLLSVVTRPPLQVMSAARKARAAELAPV